MLRTRTTAPVAALVAGLLAGPLLPVPAHADPLTCQGQVVTVTGEMGTPGDDVMVVGSAGAFSADSGAGDDLVCIRVATEREPFMFTVDAGSGALGCEGDRYVAYRCGLALLESAVRRPEPEGVGQRPLALARPGLGRRGPRHHRAIPCDRRVADQLTAIVAGSSQPIRPGRRLPWRDHISFIGGHP